MRAACDCRVAVGIERRVRLAREARHGAPAVAPRGLHPPQAGCGSRCLARKLCKHVHTRGKGQQFPHARRLDGLPGGNVQRVGRKGAGIQLVFERRTDSERILVAINASDSEYTAGHGELQGTYADLLSAEEEPSVSTADISEEEESAERPAEPAQLTLNGQLVMPPYSVQYLKAV